MSLLLQKDALLFIGACISINPFHATALSIPPENIIKHTGFLMFLRGIERSQ